MLTTEQMQTIIRDEMDDKEPSVTGKEADEFRARLQDDIKKAKANGWSIEIPAEWVAPE